MGKAVDAPIDHHGLVPQADEGRSTHAGESFKTDGSQESTMWSHFMVSQSEINGLESSTK